MKRTDCSGFAVSPSLRAQLVSVHVTYTCEVWGLSCPPGPRLECGHARNIVSWALSWPAKPPRGGHAWLVHTCKSGAFPAPLGPRLECGHAGHMASWALVWPARPPLCGHAGRMCGGFMIFTYCAYIGRLVGSLCAHMGKSWGHLGPLLDSAYC